MLARTPSLLHRYRGPTSRPVRIFWLLARFLSTSFRKKRWLDWCWWLGSPNRVSRADRWMTGLLAPNSDNAWNSIPRADRGWWELCLVSAPFVNNMVGCIRLLAVLKIRRMKAGRCFQDDTRNKISLRIDARNQMQVVLKVPIKKKCSITWCTNFRNQWFSHINRVFETLWALD